MDYTVLPVSRSLVKRVKGPFGEKRRSISGTVIATYQFKQTKTGGCLHIYDAYKADLQTQQEFILEAKRWKARWELHPRPGKTKPSL